MDPFPLGDIPFRNLLSIIRKMRFVEAARMRATCRQIEEIVSKSSKLSFDVANDITLVAAVRPAIDRFDHLSDESLELDIYVNRRCREWQIFYNSDNKTVRRRYLCDRTTIILSSDDIQPYNVEHAYFHQISIVIPCSRPSSSRPIIESEFLSFFKEAKINKCYWLNYNVNVDIEGLGLMMWVRLLHPEGVSYIQTNVTAIPMPFNILQELADAGCNYVESDICEWFPSDYARTLLKYEWIRIDHIVEGVMPSVESFAQLLLDDANHTVWLCRLPIYNRNNFLTPGEIEALGLEEKRIRWAGDRENRLAFFIATSDHFITMTEHQESDDILLLRSLIHPHYCVFRKIPKNNIEAFVRIWSEDCLPENIPYDLSDLYEYVAEHRDDYEMIREELGAFFTRITSN